MKRILHPVGGDQFAIGTEGDHDRTAVEPEKSLSQRGRAVVPEFDAVIHRPAGKERQGREFVWQPPTKPSELLSSLHDLIREAAISSGVSPAVSRYQAANRKMVEATAKLVLLPVPGAP